MKKLIGIVATVIVSGLGSLMALENEVTFTEPQVYIEGVEKTTVITKKEKKMGVINLTKEMFEAKVASTSEGEWKYLGDKPAILDFYADWCGPCRAIAPVLAELADEYDGKIYVYKINVDQEKELAAAFGVRSIPTLLFVPMEGDPQSVKGAMPKTDFVKAIEEVLLKK